MKRTKIKWILIIAFAAIVFTVCICLFINMNMIDRQPDKAFKKCFGFSLPEGAEIVSYDVQKEKKQGKPIYAFELVFPEEQYEQLRKGIDSFAYKLHDKIKYRLSDNPWEEEKDDFFDNAYIFGRWSKDLWKEKHPTGIIFYASTYNDVGYSADKGIHRTYIMFAKGKDGLFRMYAFTT